MIDPLVRAASATDGEQLRWLEREARSALTDQRGGGRWLDTHPAHGDAWERATEAGGVFVAVIDDVLVGYIVMACGAELARIDDVYVTPPARELGFGDALLGAAVECARATGARVIEGEALPGDRNTKNLYERAAIKARLITVSADL